MLFREHVFLPASISAFSKYLLKYYSAYDYAKRQNIKFIINGYTEAETEQIKKLEVVKDVDPAGNYLGYIVSDCDPSIAGKLVIPSRYNGKSVVEISDTAFDDCSLLTEITIPENYEIIIPVKLINDNIPQGIARFDDSNGNPIIEITCEDSIIITGYGSEGATSKLTITDLDTTQQMYLRLVKEDSSFIVKYSYDFEEWFEEELEKEYDLNQIHFISIGSIGRRLNPMYGEIDMNLVNIYVNDTLYLFPSLNIPFTYTEDGTKIVDCKYFYYTSNAIDAYNTANYFILDEKRQQFKLPYDSIYGHNRTLKHWRKGAESYEYDTNLECIQTGQATNGTAVVLKKPYADDNYYVSVACSSKDRFGFTPSEDSIYYTKGRIYLE